MTRTLLLSLIAISCFAFRLHAEQESLITIRALSYNIRHGQGMDNRIDLERVAKVITALGPDLVALQEVDKNCKRSTNQNQAAILGKLTGMHHRFGKFMNFQGGEYGMAILSKAPIVKTVHHKLPTGAEPRCALELQVQIEGFNSPVSFVCIHNDWTDESIRTAQTGTLLEALSKNTNPIILAGDFNGERSCKSMKTLERSGWNIITKNEDQKSATFPSNDPTIEIDYFVTLRVPSVAIDHKVLLEQEASDHRPILAVFTILPDTAKAE